ncbi:MAG: hypothetical protein CMJ59_12795 [Planctomycetaceae bacterium]|nr:hypothetical protein [Planctomycetaceae bacterium]
MSEILVDYHRIHLTTWGYLSSLLLIGLFFKFNRFWSVRNLDLVFLILLAPGLLLVQVGYREKTLLLHRLPAATLPENGDSGSGADLQTTSEEPESEPTPDIANLNSIDPPGADGADNLETDASVPAGQQELGSETLWAEKAGYIWLFVMGSLLVVRLMVDPQMIRRPLLEPNLTSGGLVFIGCSLFVFLVANVMSSSPIQSWTKSGLPGPPGNPVLQELSGFTSLPEKTLPSGVPLPAANPRLTKTVAVLAQLAIVLGIISVGHWHFNNLKMGLGPATIYLMLPSAALTPGQLTHVLPAALLVWAIVCYRYPIVSGVLVGTAIGTIYYPLFLLPLWVSFYWRGGWKGFLTGTILASSGMALVAGWMTSGDRPFLEMLQQMYGIMRPRMEGLSGIWDLGWDPIYRLPVLFAFAALSITFALWPAQKNMGTLLSCSGAIMLATQFWHGNNGGVYLEWYLPLFLLTMFRPNLEDRIAAAVVVTELLPGWRRNGKTRLGTES